MSHLAQEIQEQPSVIQGFLNKENDNIAKIATLIREFNPTYVLIAARGTSDNAARYAQYLMGIEAGLTVSLATPSVHTLYGSNIKMDKALVIGVSQSGHSEDVRLIVTDAREQGAITLGITNDENSPLANEAEHHIYLHAGEEKSVAATKSYTAQLVAMALLTIHMTQDEAKLAEIQNLPQLLADTLVASENMGQWVERYRYMERIALIGRGLNYSTAFEIALKIKELCYIVGEEYSEADFRHGPIAIISQGFPVMVVAPSGKTLPLMVDLLKKLNERGAECIVFSDDASACDLATNHVALPANIPEWLSPVCAVIPGQLFAYHLASAKGHQIDAPRGLSKVTITR
ncbi:MAG: SIS domain-containing protein [Phototrophicaceae bacterium]